MKLKKITMDDIEFEDDEPIKKTSKHKALLFSDVLKYNPNHDELGRFSSGSGGAASASGGFVPAKTMDEAKIFADKHLGIGYANYSNCGDDMKTVNMINKQIYDVYEKYPELKGSISEITSRQTSEGELFSANHDFTGRKTLNIGTDCKKGYDELKKSYEDNVENGFHPKGTTIESAVWHEFGHIYEYEHTNTNEQLNNREMSKQWIDEARGNTDTHVFQNSISTYATKNTSETFAEAFAEYNTSKTCRPEASKLMQSSGVAEKPQYSADEEEMLRMLGII